MVGKERPKKGRFVRGRDPLGEELLADKFAKTKDADASAGRRGVRGAGDATASSGDAKGGFLLPARATRRILDAARRHIEDGDEDNNGEEGDDDDNDGADGEEGEGERVFGVPEGEGSEDDLDGPEEEVELEYSDTSSQASEVPSHLGDALGDGIEEAYGIDDEESRLLAKFQPATGVQSRNLADIIMDKIAEKEARAKREHGSRAHGTGVAEGEEGEEGASTVGDSAGVDRRVAKVYSAIGGVLKHYSSGKIPKAFKVLPHVQGWEKLLMLTRPHEWSPHASYAATRIFAAALNERMAQRFYSAVLMPIVHERLAADKKLHPALYMAVRKALFKPLAFYKGFLLPLCTEGECTLREALVLASVLQKCHLPPVPTAVVIVKLCDLPFSGPNSVFIRVLVDKKMALPYQCIDALVGYFHRFCTTHPSTEALPVLWHQTLLLFVTFYKADLKPEQIELLRQVCSKHFHHLITPEVRREIAAAEGKKSYF